VARPRGDGARRYVCAKGPGLKGCGGTFLLAAHIEPFIAQAVLHRLSSPHLARALAGDADDSATAIVLHEIEADTALLERLAGDLGRKKIGLPEWESARAPIAQRLEANRALLDTQTHDRALDDLLANPMGIQPAFERLTLSQQHAIVAAVLDHAAVGPAIRGLNRFDPARVSPVWRV
jgi:hypothetical protein